MGESRESEKPKLEDARQKSEGVRNWNRVAGRRDTPASAAKEPGSAEGEKPTRQTEMAEGILAAARNLKEKGINGKQLGENPEKDLDWYNSLDRKTRFLHHRGSNRSEGLSELWKAAGRPDQQGRNWCGCFVNVALKEAGVKDSRLLNSIFGGPPALKYAASHPDRAVDLRTKSADDRKTAFSNGMVRPGDIVVFAKRGHVALVESVDIKSGNLRTIEGNSWEADGVSRVCNKAYPLSGTQISNSVFIHPEILPGNAASRGRKE